MIVPTFDLLKGVERKDVSALLTTRQSSFRRDEERMRIFFFFCKLGGD